MRDATDPDTFRRLMSQAEMPAAEMIWDDPTVFYWLARNAAPGVVHVAIDWIRFGQLLREHLGWHWYPAYPPEEARWPTFGVEG